MLVLGATADGLLLGHIEVTAMITPVYVALVYVALIGRRLFPDQRHPATTAGLSVKDIAS